MHSFAECEGLWTTAATDRDLQDEEGTLKRSLAHKYSHNHANTHECDRASTSLDGITLTYVHFLRTYPNHNLPYTNDICYKGILAPSVWLYKWFYAPKTWLIQVCTHTHTHTHMHIHLFTTASFVEVKGDEIEELLHIHIQTHTHRNSCGILAEENWMGGLWGSEKQVRTGDRVHAYILQHTHARRHPTCEVGCCLWKGASFNCSMYV